MESLNDNILAGVIGGIITGLFVPVINYFFPRYYNIRKTSIRLEYRQEGAYIVWTLIVKNSSLATLKNLYAHVTINNNSGDIVTNEGFQIFCPNTNDVCGMLSWAKNIDGNNYPNIDINQGQEQDINFVRFHNNTLIEVASEQGFYDKRVKNTSRTVLRANKNYTFQVKLTGDNIAPKEIKISFNNEQRIFSLV